MPRKKSLLPVAVAIAAVSLSLPDVARSQASPDPLGPSGPPISDLDLANRLKDTDARDTEAIATLELTYWTSGDLKSVMVKKNPQNLFVTLELDGEQLKDVARNKKPKLRENTQAGNLFAKGRWSRPGKRLEADCQGQLRVGFQQIIFFPYGGETGHFGCEVLTRLLPDEEFTAWKEGLPADQSEAYYQCAGVHPRGSGEFWTCIDESGIPFPRT